MIDCTKKSDISNGDCTMQNGTKKRKNGIDTYQRILKISSELFARNGFDGVSVYDIAKGFGDRRKLLI